MCAAIDEGKVRNCSELPEGDPLRKFTGRTVFGLASGQLLDCSLIRTRCGAQVDSTMASKAISVIPVTEILPFSVGFYGIRRQDPPDFDLALQPSCACKVGGAAARASESLEDGEQE